MEKKVSFWNRKTLSFIGALALILLIIIITIQNTREVQMSLLFWKIHSSLILLIFISFLVGVLTTLLVLMPSLTCRDNNGSLTGEGQPGEPVGPSHKKASQQKTEDDEPQASGKRPENQERKSNTNDRKPTNDHQGRWQ